CPQSAIRTSRQPRLRIRLNSRRPGTIAASLTAAHPPTQRFAAETSAAEPWRRGSGGGGQTECRARTQVAGESSLRQQLLDVGDALVAGAVEFVEFQSAC